MLANKTAIVTGGSGAIGQAICIALAEQGAAVAFTYHQHPDKAAELCAALDGLGCRHLARQVDGKQGAAVAAFVQQVEQELGGVDVLVNCLGAAQVMPFALIEEEDWDEMMQVNLKSMFLFSKAVARGMIRRRAGAIVNISSIAGHRLLEVPVHYAAAKAGVSGFTLALAKELCRYGIRANAVAPGLIEGGVGANVSQRQLEDFNRFCALGRPGTPREVAHLVTFLASDNAAYINAQTIFVDGGL